MYKRRKPCCKKCGSYTHWTYQHWGNKPQQKPIAKRKIKPLSATFDSKTVKVSSAKKNEQSKRKKLIKELDKYTSLICRWSNADSNGNVRCYTCSRIMPVWEAQCGHYISRKFQHTRWLQANVRPQGRCCNIYKSGNYQVYEPKIKAELGEDEVLKLWDKAYDRRKIPTYELEETLIKVNQDYKELINARKEKGWKC